MLQGLIPGMPHPVSRLILGTATLPTDRDPNEWLSGMLALGINTFDTARVYGDSEATLGRWFEACGTRSQINLITKGCHPDGEIRRVSEACLRADLETSLEKLRTDHVDLYLLHRDDPEVPVETIIDTLNALKEEGKILSFGASNWMHQRIEAANAYAEKHGLTAFAASSVNYTLAEPVGDPWGGNSVSIAGEANLEGKKWYVHTQMPVLAYSPLAHGFFAGKMKSSDKSHYQDFLDEFAIRGYVSDWNFERLRRCEVIAQERGATVPMIALGWILRQRLNLYAIVSSTSEQRMKQNMAALIRPLIDEDCRFLNLNAF